VQVSRPLNFVTILKYITIIIILFIFSILVNDKQCGKSNIEQIESDNSDNSHESVPFLLGKKLAALNNYPNSKGNSAYYSYYMHN